MDKPFKIIGNILAVLILSGIGLIVIALTGGVLYLIWKAVTGL